MKEQTRNTEVQINVEEIGKSPGKELRIMIVKMIKNLVNKMEKMQESINKDLEELKNKHTETNNTSTEIKTTLEGINSRISEGEKRISVLKWMGMGRFNSDDNYTYYCRQGILRKHEVDLIVNKRVLNAVLVCNL